MPGREFSGRGAYAALEAETGAACAAADIAFGRGQSRGGSLAGPAVRGQVFPRVPDRGQQVLLAKMSALNIVQKSVVDVADHGVDRAGRDTDLGACRAGVAHHGVGDPVHRQGVGEGNGRFDGAEFPDLVKSGGFPEAVEHETARLDFFPENIPSMGKDDGDAGPYRALADFKGAFAFDQGEVADPDTRYVGNGVVFSRFERAENDAKIPWPGSSHSVPPKVVSAPGRNMADRCFSL